MNLHPNLTIVDYTIYNRINRESSLGKPCPGYENGAGSFLYWRLTSTGTPRWYLGATWDGTSHGDGGAYIGSIDDTPPLSGLYREYCGGSWADSALSIRHVGCGAPEGITEAECRFQRSIPGRLKFEREERTCLPVSCGAYAAPANARVSPTGARSYQQTVNISCNAGYELTADARFSATPTCQANGEFTSGKRCARKSCSPFLVANGMTTPSAGAVSGQRMVISCNRGYQMSGEASFTCDKGLYQMSTSPSCERISCGNLSIVDGKVMSSTGMLFGDTTKIACNAGFYLFRMRGTESAFHAECNSYGEPRLSSSACRTLRRNYEP